VKGATLGVAALGFPLVPEIAINAIFALFAAVAHDLLLEIQDYMLFGFVLSHPNLLRGERAHTEFRGS
jgi:hypothetical protein